MGKGHILVGAPEAALAAAGIVRETLTDSSLRFVRRSVDGARTYYVVNKGDAAFRGWAPLASKGATAALLDPMTGTVSLAATRAHDAQLDVFLELEPGATVCVRVLPAVPAHVARHAYWRSEDKPNAMVGEWQVQFIAGGPELPHPYATTKLGSWTAQGGDAMKRFAGTARYTLTFDAPAGATDVLLSLGDVAQSARVRLNGHDCGTLVAAPFEIVLTDVHPSGNVLELEVTSVAANRIRDLDRRGVQWKTFRDINFVDLDYKPFDASQWPLRDVGLLGPVTVRPVSRWWPR